MEDPSRSIDSSLVPSMMELNVSEASDCAEALLQEMRESQELCKRLLDRLQFLRTELKRISSQGNAAQHAKVSAQSANALGLVVRFLKKYSEKRLLQRIATSSAIRREVRALHAKIDAVFTAAGLTGSPLMTEWQKHEEADIAAQHRHLEEVLRSHTNLTVGVSDSMLEEALAELKFEIDGDNGESEETIELLTRVLDTVVEMTGNIIPEIPEWYVRRDDVVLGKVIDLGSFGEVHEGVYNGKEVCVKRLYLDGFEAQKDFLKETAVWYDLSHPNVVKMIRGCHVGKPLFFVSEYAKKGNFTDYFKVEAKENRRSMWRLFHQAALGLAYLHQNRKVHCDIKCNNILVDEDGTAKLCDFGYSHTKNLSIGKSIKEQPSSARWKAPECMLEQGAAANPTCMSDVYSLGMAIIEAKIGDVPWGVMSDDEIIENLAEGHSRPKGVFSDKGWEVVQGMTAFDVESRWTLDKAIEKLGELVRLEANPILCSRCQSSNHFSQRFCGECGAELVLTVVNKY